MIPVVAPIWKGLVKVLKADLHIHTEYSSDCDTPLEKIIARCLKVGINCIAITDHGTIEGAIKMQEIASFPVIIAEEILTPHGEIMGFFLEEGVPSGLSIEQTISRIKAQGALVGLPHPFDTIRRLRVDSERLEELVEQLDFIETFNARSPFPWTSIKARAFAEKHGIAKSAGSDAHSLIEIGNACVEMPEFEGKDDFLQALAEGKIQGNMTNPVVHFRSLWARLKRHL